MNDLEKEFLSEETGGAEPRLCVRSGTRIDAGRWWRRNPVWLCVAGGDLILLAVARRRYFERVAMADCPSTRYCHASGELVIEPRGELRLNRLALSPREALEVLDLLNTNRKSDS